MRKIRLKYPVYDFNLDEIISEVGLHISHEVDLEPVEAKRKSGKPSEPPSLAKLTKHESYRLAEAYAREALSIPLLRARYKEMGERQGKSPEKAAIADYLRGTNL